MIRISLLCGRLALCGGLFAATAIQAQAVHLPTAPSFGPQAIDAMTTATAPAAFAEVTVPALLPSYSSSEIDAETVDAALPDAPSTLLTAYASPAAYEGQNPYNPKNRPAGPHVAPRHTKYIPAGWQAQPITAHDKVIIGLRDLYSPLTLMGDLLSAGYSDLVNGQPNYGTNGKAIGQRIGATVLRDSTEGIFTDMVFAPILREDPRYYVEGPKHNFFQRVIYAGTRPILTRTDSGRSTINGAELLGYAAASGLSYSYYPQINRNFKDTAATFGGGLGGSAIGFVVSEFSDQFLQAIHLEKRD